MVRVYDPSHAAAFSAQPAAPPPGRENFNYQPHASILNAQASESSVPLLYPSRILARGATTLPATTRRTVDYEALVATHCRDMAQGAHATANLHNGDPFDVATIQPAFYGALKPLPPYRYRSRPGATVTPTFVHVSTNKLRCSVNAVCWSPEGRRLMTGSQSGEFTIWNARTFSFEVIMQAHETAIRTMRWSASEQWLLTADDSGIVKLWQPSLNNVKFSNEGHKEAVRGIAFAPSDLKFVTASDDTYLQVWDLPTFRPEKMLKGHGGDVKCVDWHPTKGLIASGSKDSLVKLWDPRIGDGDKMEIATLYGHKNTVTDLSWNRNGHWLLTSSRDQLAKVFDLRKIDGSVHGTSDVVVGHAGVVGDSASAGAAASKSRPPARPNTSTRGTELSSQAELGSYRGHPREVVSVAWHPACEEHFVTGGFDGSLNHWLVTLPNPVWEARNAHDAAIWSMQFSPLGHLLATGSNDYATKFWARSRPGSTWKNKDNDLTGGAEIPAGRGMSGPMAKKPRTAPPSGGYAPRPPSGPPPTGVQQRHQPRPPPGGPPPR
ncbi:hypothetical protein PPROV_000447700 [Pycnococcus provasolii]|uniref:IFT140 first beta-propeller domain-containing protein n=2 Tax=Pycnococcus provasolii TaxID=41880 RepID=A0A830HL42_9CHLO|nr:hypothetical protein PPROV_000447700 [Pycnococcus provasolii]